jgi:Sec-independent protein translocase protein TatA
VGLGLEMLFMIFLGLVILGPKRLSSLLGQVARAKADFERTKRGIQSQFAAEFSGESPARRQRPCLESANELRDFSSGKL